ncbi:MAG: hypothetical protein ACRC7O_08175 [Fimbriiglobus sp.]
MIVRVWGMWVGVLLAGPAAAADPVAVVAEELAKATTVFEADTARIEKLVEASLDRREKAARTNGNKDWVDLVKADRKTFADIGRIPTATSRTIWQEAVASRTKYAAALDRAVAGYTRGRKDDLAAETERKAKAFVEKTAYLDPAAVPLANAATDGVDVTWRYTTTRPANTWHTPKFDDTTWATGPAPFGVGLPSIRTHWAGREIWLRRIIEVPDGKWVQPSVRINSDDVAVVYINGEIARSQRTWTEKRYITVPVQPAAEKALKPGLVTIAVSCGNFGLDGIIDVGLVDVLPPKKKK